ncbi:MAG: twin-arginine translocation signal domain-containing protein [Selenomonadaceae bacterium]|nr:twin-arginine translocation signal domain-containing protein [Selenomonadaceae bacterium]
MNRREFIKTSAAMTALAYINPAEFFF